MKNTTLTIVCLALVIGSCSTKQVDPLVQSKSYLKIEMDSMHLSMLGLKEAIESGDDQSTIQQFFREGRRHYKLTEAVNEFYFPGLCEFINGPALDEADEYDDKETEATGFQVIEELIFPAYDTTAKSELLNEVEILLSTKARYNQLYEGLYLTRENMFEAIRLELLRIVALGLSGFDSPIAQLSISEANFSLEGIESILKYFTEEPSNELLWTKLHEARAYLDQHPDFNSFGRAEFIIDHLNPLAGEIYNFQQTLKIDNNDFLVAVNLDKGEFFSPEMFNREFFLQTGQHTPNSQTVNLGKTLFFDPILSGNLKRSCASCHQPQKAFAENQSKSAAFNFEGQISRNAPSLVNAAFQRSQFWDQRIHFIEDQITDVVTNKDEMHGDLDKAFSTVMTSEEYREMFEAAFGKGQNFSSRQIREALAAYIRSLEGMNSRFDQYLRGDKTKLSEDEITGFNLFMGKGKCGTCHFMPLFNGTVPPNFTETEAEVLALPTKNDSIDATPDQDLGKYHAYKRALFKHAFKTPTVRNAGLTAPYMHNGVFATLEEVMDFYNRGGGSGIGITLENQTLPPDKLNLATKEKQQIISFIHSLTDTAGITSVPKRLPVFEKEILNARLVGGHY